MGGTITSWGATADERELPLPCDQLVPDGAVLLRAVDVDAPPEVVFRWLCQLRVAPYSYDLIDNFGRRSPRQLTPGVERLEVGQRFMTIFRLREFEEGSRITLMQRGGLFGDVGVTYVVSPRNGGSRLLMRIAWRSRRLPLLRPLLSAGDFVMARRQLLNLKRLAERQAA